MNHSCLATWAGLSVGEQNRGLSMLLTDSVDLSLFQWCFRQIPTASQYSPSSTVGFNSELSMDFDVLAETFLMFGEGSVE